MRTLILAALALTTTAITTAPALATATSPGDVYFNNYDVAAGTVYIPSSYDMTNVKDRRAAAEIVADAVTGRHVSRMVEKIAVGCDSHAVYVGDITPDARSLFRANLDERLRTAPLACKKQS